MPRRKSGYAKSTTIRVHPTTKQNIKMLKLSFGMSTKRSDGDVIDQLISTLINEKVKYPNLKLPQSITLDLQSLESDLAYYKCQYEEQVATLARWKLRCEYLCKKYGLHLNEIIEKVKQ